MQLSIVAREGLKVEIADFQIEGFDNLKVSMKVEHPIERIVFAGLRQEILLNHANGLLQQIHRPIRSFQNDGVRFVSG